MFPHESHKMLPPGLNRQATRLLCCYGGFLTWAAKPSVRESPDPANLFANQIRPASPLRQLFTHSDSYAFAPVEVPFVAMPVIFSWTVRAPFR